MNGLSIPDLSKSRVTKCPEASEEYRSINRKAAGRTQLRNEHHRVKTQQTVTVRGGEVKLQLTAKCDCGWSDTTWLPQEADDD